MTPMEFTEAAIKLYGRKHWVRELAKALSVDVTTIRRMCKREHVEGPYEVAIRGLLQHKRASEIIDRAKRRGQRLLAKRFKGRQQTWQKGVKHAHHDARKHKRKVKKYDDIEDLAKRGLAKPGVDYSAAGSFADTVRVGAGTVIETTVPDARPVPNPLPDAAGGEDADGNERGA